MINRIKSINRALLELNMGIIFVGVVCQVVGIILTSNKIYYSMSLWFGVLLAVVTSYHMYRTLDKALDMGIEASKIVISSNVIRYFVIVVIFTMIMITQIMNPLIVFLGFITLKVAAYLQPFTHKFCNILFHETDPIPEAMPEELEEEVE